MGYNYKDIQNILINSLHIYKELSLEENNLNLAKNVNFGNKLTGIKMVFEDIISTLRGILQHQWLDYREVWDEVIVDSEKLEKQGLGTQEFSALEE